MKEIECRKGFTLIELMIVLVIIGIFGMFIIAPMIADGMELQKPILATDGTITTVAKAMRSDTGQTVTVMVYAVDWGLRNFDTVDKFLAERSKVIKQLVNLGISRNRISTLLANKGGLIEDAMPIPAEDGVYLYLD